MTDKKVELLQQLDHILPILKNGQTAKLDDLTLSGSADTLSVGATLRIDPRDLSEVMVQQELRRIRSRVDDFANRHSGLADFRNRSPFQAYVYVGKPDRGEPHFLVAWDDGSVHWSTPLPTLNALTDALDRFDPAKYLPSYWPQGSHYPAHPGYAESLYRECGTARMVKNPEAFRKFVDKTLRIFLYWGTLSKCKPKEKGVFLKRFGAFVKEIEPILRAKFEV